jgi:hypothetical protein
VLPPGFRPVVSWQLIPTLFFEREGSTNILVSGGEGRTAARQNVPVTTDYRNVHRRWTADFFLKVLISCRVIKPVYRVLLMPIKLFALPVGIAFDRDCFVHKARKALMIFSKNTEWRGRPFQAFTR